VIIIPNAAEEAFLDLILAVNYTLKLFTNDITADADYPDLVGAVSFTEASFSGYSSKALTGGSWVTTQGDPSVGTYAAQTFTRSSSGAAQIVRGWYLVTTTGGNLRAYETIGPYSVADAGDNITIVPTLPLRDAQDA
jgi:hypothetical protein